MNNRISKAWNDTKTGENIDAYLTLVAAIVVSLLGLFGIVDIEKITSLTLGVLALLAYSSLKNRHQATDYIKSQLGLHFLFSNSSPVQEERLRIAKTISHNGITLVGSSNALLDVFKDCAARGGEVKLVVIDPANVALDVAAQRFSKYQDAKRLKREVQHSLDNLKSILGQNCKVRLLRAMAPFSLWIIDEDDNQGEIWLGLYPFRGKTEPWLKILPGSNKKMFDFLVEQFKLLWEASSAYNAESINLDHIGVPN
ncbi:MAG: hypothetical protein Q8L35_00280 [Actinomycetota bacterium]|nr:hypothetical protein [Actinomycetota bacterium]